MDYSVVEQRGKDLLLPHVSCFHLEDILQCGQAFRWFPSGEHQFQGVAFGRALTISQQGNCLVFHNTTPEEFHALWEPYFDLTRDYGEVQDYLSANPTLRRAIAHAPGIRVLRQEPWETLCTFIFSQNNNIKRIQGLVQRFSALFGEEIAPGLFAFPSIERIASATLEDLQPVRAGFRGKYILDAAQQVASGAVSLAQLFTQPLEEARKHLMQIHGVGPKVADCVLLFGFGRLESFPMDVWMLRMVDTFYPGGFPMKYQKYAGLAQQYLFHFVRSNPHLVKEPKGSNLS